MTRLVAVFAIGVSAILSPHYSLAEDSLCLKKYKAITEQFYTYNEKSAAYNAAMDRIGNYTSGEDVSKIRPEDADRWNRSIADLIPITQGLLQNMMEYRALGCSPDQQTQMNQMVDKLTEDLKIARANQNSLKTRLPASTFK
jgi:hypothetical protein